MSEHVIESISDVRLVGRLGRQVDQRTLPSGDEITVFSIVIDRPPRERRGRTHVDTIGCVTSRRSVTAGAVGWQAGQWVEATGVLRRRFWRSGSGLGSAMEVDVRHMRRVRDS